MTKQLSKKTSIRKTSGKVRPSSAVHKGLDGLAKSFTNVGIPPVLETQMLPQRKGISGHLQRVGNILLRPSEHSLKIKL